uniref:Uncharacterized protein n=1 Tax=Macrostomum lignano TaxID=282301 RepID=A0A1I8FBC2_9PLAT
PPAAPARPRSSSGGARVRVLRAGAGEELPEGRGLADQLPLLIVCDRFDFISDLVLHLYRQPQLHKYPGDFRAEGESGPPAGGGGGPGWSWTARRTRSASSSAWPAPTSQSRRWWRPPSRATRLRLLQSCWKRGRLTATRRPRCTTPWRRSTSTPNTGAERFLRDNQHYDSKVVGRYTEKAESPTWPCWPTSGRCCADDLIRVCQENSFYRRLARFLVRRKDEALWTSVLREPSDHRRQLIDQ